MSTDPSMAQPQRYSFSAIHCIGQVRRSYTAPFSGFQIAHCVSHQPSHSQPSFARSERLRSFLMTSSQLVKIEQMPTTRTDRLIAYEVRYRGPKTVLKTCGPTMPLSTSKYTYAETRL